MTRNAKKIISGGYGKEYMLYTYTLPRLFGYTHAASLHFGKGDFKKLNPKEWDTLVNTIECTNEVPEKKIREMLAKTTVK